MCYYYGIKNEIGGKQDMDRFIELNAEDKLLEDAVNMAFGLLYSNDKYLIDHQVNER